MTTPKKDGANRPPRKAPRDGGGSPPDKPR